MFELSPDQTISFGQLADQTYGVAPITLSATATSGLPVSFSVISGPATVSGEVLTVTGVGTVDVEASQAGNGFYSAATPVDETFTVAPAQLTVTGLSGTDKVYDGGTADTLSGTATLNGVVGTDQVTLTDGTAAFQDANAGTGKTVVFSGFTLGGSDSGNYSLSQPADSTANITPAPLTITANKASRLFGQANPALTASYSGFVNGETLATSGVTGSPILATGSTPSSAPGTYPISVAQGSLSAANYSFAIVNGTLTVTPAPTPVLVPSDAQPVVGETVAFTVQLPTTGSGVKKVIFMDGNRTLGTGVITGSFATFSTNSLPGGVHAIKAKFVGAKGAKTSFSPTIHEAVTPLATNALLTGEATTNPSGYRLEVRVTAASPTGGTPKGVIVFSDNHGTRRTVTLNHGVATWVVRLKQGIHRTYSAFFRSSTSSYSSSSSNQFSTN